MTAGACMQKQPHGGERLRSLPLIPKTMWREGYDYPSDDDEQDDDFFERADHDYEQLNDK